MPQLIARVNSYVTPIQKLVHKLLGKIGKVHPQALIYPLTVCTYSQSTSRKKSAQLLLNQMRAHSAVLVEQALLVSHELIRVAILWNELWHEALEEASRLFFGEKDVEGMIKTLKPLHAMMDKAETLSEVGFQQAFGRDLQEALEWCKKFKESGKESDMNQAWDLYYYVFRRISKQLHHMIKLELQYVSPKLMDAYHLDLAVPGTYRLDSRLGGVTPVVQIAQSARQLKVITSKQRPRKLKMFGLDGNEYQFLLKGHEDLRQDERVMQLFGLVNTMLRNDPETSTRDLTIKRYSVIPLSSNAGLIGWVDNCDTLHALIKDYRESRNVLLNIEHRLMLQMATDYDNLALMQKIEVFEYALENTTGQDLYKVLWLKSRNSEVWLDRRTNYTRSLATMSMVGYILGLGDRHPSNLMLEKLTGKIVHIDFGDCFEVAMHRDKFPEKIPFRLTRMLINAMEVCGIEGTFRSTCESVMRVLRDNKDSVMAMLEAFVHDPLINWRLLETTPVTNGNHHGGNHGNAHHHHHHQAQNQAKMMQDMNHQDGGAMDDSHNKHPSRSIRERELKKNLKNESDDEENDIAPNTLNKRALNVIHRISNKLNGRDFDVELMMERGGEDGGDDIRVLDVPDQVQRLIEQATSNANLCQCYVGWCAFW
ncbi:phosphatidylinositol kinase-related protein kinase TOR [Acrasis kona]|uniref:non-specific serine/threonine protein kinase n=1 Tax=Acrasis kona TaxID=1008807 RepID=A0AAW2ZAM7_9EUKA